MTKGTLALLCLSLAAGAARAEDPAPAAANPPAANAPDDRRTVKVEKAPKPIGPYSQAVVAGNLIFASGQTGTDPKTQSLVPGIRAQTEQALNNLEAVLAGAGATFADVVKVTLFVADLSDFAAVNEIYGKRFPKDPPARSTVQVTELPKLARIEIDLIAVKR